MEHAIGLSILGAVLALDYAMVGQFMISQPLVLGGLFGWILGDAANGLLVGSLIQLLWVGVLPVGAYVPSDHTVTGGVAVALTGMLVHQHGFALGPSLVFALGIAIPAGAIAGKLDVGLRHLNSRFAHEAEWLVDRFGSAGIVVLNLAGLIPAFLRNFIIYLVWLIPGAMLALKIYKSLPLHVIHGMTLAFWLLPILSVAVILEIIAKEDLRGWILGAFGLGLTLFWIWPGHGLLIFTAAAAAGAVLAWRRRGW